MSPTPLEKRIEQDIHAAMKSGDQVRRDILRMVKADLMNEEIARGKPLDEGTALEVVSRRVKRGRESIEEFRKGGRPDLVAREEAQVQVLLAYLPQQMGEAEVQELARKAIAEVGAKGPSDKGKVMGKLMPLVKGKADGKLVSDVVTHLLSQ
ncbi:MAG: GatB/YqeY domain-containing protein [Chloroflexi bacterium]|nr:GatB/YqeY domain-containing protein [Chloroflexota bacterium]